MAVYDPEKTNQNDLTPRALDTNSLRDQEAMATSPDARASAAQRNQEMSALQGGGFASSSPNGVTGADDDTVGKGYQGYTGAREGVKDPFKNMRLRANKKKTFAGLGILGFGAGGIVTLFMYTLPLKIVHMTENLQDQFFASAEQASEDMTDNLLRHYIVQQLVPGMIANNCTTTRVSRACANTSTSTTIVGVLYNSWRDGRLEEKLANNHSIEIRREGNRFFLHTPNNGRTELGEYDSSNTRDFEGRAFRELSRTELRREIRGAFEAESFAKRIMYRYSVGGLLERKYGVRRCITACQTRDAITNNVDSKKNAFKSYFVERVVIPRNEALGIAMQCAIGGFNCAETPTEADENGERRSQYEQELQARLTELRSNMGQEDLEELDRRTEEIRNKGLVSYGIEQLLGETTGRVVTRGVPIIGWIDLGVRFVNGAQNAGPAIKKMAYVTNSTTAVAVFQMYRTSADEIKTGNVDAAVIGSVSESLGPDPDNDQGGGGAEAHPAYDDLMGGQRIAWSGNNSVYAAEKKVTTYTCNNGSRPASGELCPEETLGNVNGKASATADAISNMSNSPMFRVAFPGGQATIDGWTRFISPIIDAAGVLAGDALDAVASLVPGYNDLKAKVTEFSKGVVETLGTWLIPSSLSDKPSGARNVALAAVGADVSGNEFAHYGLGGKRISDQQAQEIRTARLQAEQQEFRQRSFVARVFDTDSKYSVVSRVALSMPSNTKGVQQSVASIFSNPLQHFSSLLGSLFAGKSALAQTTSRTHDPAGVTQNGYDRNDPVFSKDPDTTWKENDCDNPETKKKWGEKGTLNPETQQIEHDVTNPCLLVRSSVSSGGGKYNKSLLENPESSGGAATQTPADSGSVSGSVKELAQQILDLAKSGKIVIGDYSSDPGSDRASRSLASQQLEDLAAGKGARSTTRCGFSLPATIEADEKILQFLVDLGQTEKYTLNSLFGQCHSRTSNHYQGKAVDFGCPLNTAAADKVGQKYGVSHNFENCAAHRHWHYSVGGD